MTNLGDRRPHSFSSRSKKDHAFHRRRISIVYTKSALFGSKPLASLTRKLLLGSLIPQIQDYASEAKPNDILKLTYALCLDFVTAFIFGYTNGSKFLRNKKSLQLWLEQFERRNSKAAFWSQELPTTTRILKTVGIDLLPQEYYASKHYLEQWMLHLCERADMECLLAGNGSTEDSADVPIVYQQLKKAVETDMAGEDAQTKKLEIASELLDHICMQKHPLQLKPQILTEAMIQPPPAKS